MDWRLAIERNRDALLRIVALLFASTGLTKGASSVPLSRPVYRTVLMLLRPAESAVRRLIVMAARDVSVSPRPACPCPAQIPCGPGVHQPAFPLFDPRKRLGPGFERQLAPTPRFSVPGFDDPAFPLEHISSRDDSVDVERLCRRLQALRIALDTLPEQARRFARWRQRRQRDSARSARAGRIWPFRPGTPPGHRARPVHEVDSILADCHALALHALEQPAKARLFEARSSPRAG